MTALRGAPPLPAPDDVVLPGGVRVAGGAGGTLAHLEDLAAAAAALDRAADALADAAIEVLRLQGVVEAASPWSPATAPAAWSVLGPLRSSWSAPGPAAARLRDRAAAVRGAAQLYRETDAHVARVVGQAVSAAGTWVGGLLGEAGPPGWVAAGALAVAAAPPLLVLSALGGGGHRLPSSGTVQLLMPGLAAFLRHAAPGRQAVTSAPVPGAARALGVASALVTTHAGTPRPGLVVAPVVRPGAARGPSRDAPRPTSAADVLRHVHALYPHPDDAPGAGTGGIPGTVGVQRLDHDDGRRTWVVAIPGTQDWSPVAGPNPMSLSSNFAIIGGAPDDATRTVVEAMTQAGVAPGEPVLLAGHSQGGMVATAIAADPALAERFAVAAVLTAGSPVAAVDLPAGVAALHLQHDGDYVWTLDGAANPATPGRTTVSADLAVAPDPVDRAAAGSPVTAHGIDVYARTAERLATTDHPSLRAFDAAVAALVGDGRTRVTTQRYVGVRVPGS
ncbi:hypothetical protein [Actinotalea sp. JY-7876]|uniref:PGAP1-like alpha/beta domain-containing protein n=1 Tax=Actinotalea sp. JY-7876 TaxID=2758442 RepID=UPI0015F6AF09|nr:hypothetical protein [Actinotalea sp. JY-7876]